MFKGTSSKDEKYFINMCCEIDFLLESLGRMKMGRVKGWISDATHPVDKTRPSLLCGLQIVPVYYSGV